MLNQGDNDLIVFLAAGGGCSLATTKEKDNWVDKAGHLPDYICKIAKAIKRSGKSTSQAIAIAVSRVKKWAAGGDDVNADTRAKAAAAVAQWEALKAKSKVKATAGNGDSYLMLSNVGSFNTDMVRRAFEESERQARVAFRAANPPAPSYGEDTVPSEYYDYRYIRELWTDHLVVTSDRSDDEAALIPYSVDGDKVVFGETQKIKKVWVTDTDEDLDQWEKALLADVLVLSKEDSHIAKLTAALKR